MAALLAAACLPVACKKSPVADCKTFVARSEPRSGDEARQFAYELAKRCSGSSNAQILAASILASLDRRLEALPLIERALKIDSDWTDESRRGAKLVLESFRAGSAKKTVGAPSEETAVSVVQGS